MLTCLELARLIDRSLAPALAPAAAATTAGDKGNDKNKGKGKGKGKGKANAVGEGASDDGSNAAAATAAAVKIGNVLTQLSAPLSSELAEAIALDIVDGVLGDAFQSTASALDVVGWSTLLGLGNETENEDGARAQGDESPQPPQQRDDDADIEGMLEDGPPPEAAAFEQLAAAARAADCVDVGSSSYVANCMPRSPARTLDGTLMGCAWGVLPPHISVRPICFISRQTDGYGSTKYTEYILHGNRS